MYIYVYIVGRKLWSFYPPGVIPPGISVHKQSGGVGGDTDADEYRVESPSSSHWFRYVLPNLLKQSTQKGSRDDTADLTPILHMQLPGQIIFIPAGWWHCTINIDNSVALTQNVIRKENLKLSATVFSTVDARAADQLALYFENLIAHQK